MNTTRKPRPRGMTGALNEWEATLAKVEATPTYEHLDDLCGLLDIMDMDIVRKWGTDGHQWRRDVLSRCRAAARRANASVTAAQLTGAQERGRKAMATRRARAEVVA